MAKTNMAKTSIVLNVSGGKVQDVFCSAPDAEMMIVDWDVENSESDTAGLTEVFDDQGHTVFANVLRSHPCSLQDLCGTDVQVALDRAGMLPNLSEYSESDVRKYILFDFDAGDLATTNVYDDYREATEDASELNNVIVMPLVFQKESSRRIESQSTRPGLYRLAIDGPLFRLQRQLLLKLRGLAAGRIPNVLDLGDRELLDGLIELTDQLADQAHDNQGMDCLLDAGDRPCECQKPGYFCSGVPGILAHLENGRMAPDAKIERCDLCRRYASDEAALQKLREVGHDAPR